ncbi:hypothetical protein ABWH98_25080 [Labrenzia sp. ac12]
MLIGIATSGLWRLRYAVELMTGCTACRLPPLGLGVDAIAGWGHKPTADRAREIARLQGIPYIAFEDGFLRSISPGTSEKPLSMVMDRTGIYYDARQPSDLEAMVRKRASSPQPLAQIRLSMENLRKSRLSKYNNSKILDASALQLKASRPEDRVLVVDQTAGDASIAGAMASEDTFAEMLDAAATENPGAEIIVRVHPEARLGRKSGHFGYERLQEIAKARPEVGKALKTDLLRLTAEPINPWSLLEACSTLYCVSSQLGFEGVMAGCAVHCFGASFYNGWGLTSDRSKKKINGREKVSIEVLFAAVYLDYVKYIDHEERKISTYEDTVRRLLSNLLE